MEHREIIYDVSGAPVARLTLNRPDRLNAYTSQMCREILDALDRYGRDDRCRVLVLTGAGRAFCSGGDVRSTEEVEEAASRQLGQGMIMRESMHAVNLALHRLDKPVIAMINGPAVAGGLTLALLCDLRIAAASARLGDTSSKTGLLPDEGGAWVFPRAVGLEAGLRMTWLHEVYSADEAKRLGLVGEVVPDDQLEARVAEVAAAIAAGPPLAIRLAKRMMRRAQEMTFEQALGDAEFAVHFLNESADVREGVAAFIERRPAVFQGR
jgi:2-(1,2-epoxy-1,2-dihydrophenyl)acetyl-CoA isomerase